MVVTDLDAMTAMLTRAGIEYETRTPNPEFPRSFRDGTTTQLVVEDMGYTGFYSVLGFDADGRLLSVGAWE